MSNSNGKNMTTRIEKQNINDELPEEMLMEVLARLPAKSIARFKCVSKDWLALFTSNLTFRQLYKARAYTRKGGVLHVIPPSSYHQNPSHGWDRRIFVIDTRKPPNVRGNVIHLSSLPFDVNMRTNIIDGLICFYNDNFGSIYLCNIFTREIIGLPPAKEMYETRRCIIGYDPNNKVYKVVRVCTTKRRLNVVECEVLTLISNDNAHTWIQNENTSCWRSIDISYIDSDYLWGSQSDDDGFYLNGVIYWISQYKKQGIILLDVEKEKLQVIKCPDELFYSGDKTLAYIQGHLSLVMINRLHNSETDTCRIEITWWKIVHDEHMESPLLTSTIFDCPFPRFCPRFRWSCGRRCCCNHLGQVFSVRWVIGDKGIVDCYDINTGKYKELHVNNAQGMLLRPFYKFNPTMMVENIIFFNSIKFTN